VAHPHTYARACMRTATLVRALSCPRRFYQMRRRRPLLQEPSVPPGLAGVRSALGGPQGSPADLGRAPGLFMREDEAARRRLALVAHRGRLRNAGFAHVEGAAATMNNVFGKRKAA